MLEIKDLAVQYGNQIPTIEHFDLSMKKGEIISIVGESGSGKTTVIRAVLGALPGAGRVPAGDILLSSANPSLKTPKVTGENFAEARFP